MRDKLSQLDDFKLFARQFFAKKNKISEICENFSDESILLNQILAKSIMMFWKIENTQIAWIFGSLNSGNIHQKNSYLENLYPEL